MHVSLVNVVPFEVVRRYHLVMVGDIWKETNHFIVPASSRQVMAVVGSIGVYDTGQRFAWRGMSNADYALTSSLHRQVGGPDEAAVRTSELSILREARSWGLGTHATGRVDDLQLLSDLQHFEVPTRLIDVTSNPMTALWFACQDQTPDSAGSGLLLALNVTKWNRLSTVAGAGELTRASLNNPEGARLEQAINAGDPFVVESAAPNARLRAQEGFFVSGSVPSGPPAREVDMSGEKVAVVTRSPFQSIRVEWPAGTSPEELERRLLNPDVGRPRSLPFVAVIIKANLKSKLRKYLEGTYNRSARVLFPDYQGYSRYGEFKFGL